jgi:microcystin degradation protein MlrC
MLGPLQLTDTEIGGFLAAAQELRFEAVPTFAAWAWPAGPLTDDCFRTVLEHLRAGIEAAGEIDGLLLTIHGALLSETEEDADGVILAEARSCLGPGVPLVATFDFHANLSPLMVASCDALIGYNTYPHVDLRDCGAEAACLLHRMLAGEIRPMMALTKPPLMPHIVRQRTADGPMAALMRMARQAEGRAGVLRVSVAGGFAYADVPRMGMGILAIADGDGDLAAEVAHEIAEEAWARRKEFAADLPDARTAVRQALAAPGGPVVLADLADNVGGGSPGDGTELLAELLAQLEGRPATGPALVLLADAEAVAQAIGAGVRERVRLRLGGKADRDHGDPVWVEGEVRLIADGRFLNRGPMRDGLVDDQGRTVVLECGPLLLVLTERKMPMWNLEQLRSLGIEPTRLGIIVVKGAVAHRAAYGPIAAEMIEVATSGACAGDVRQFTYQNVRRPLFPLDVW